MSEMNSFQDAFYIIAKELGFDYAQPLSPREVFEQQMLPRIRELVANQAAAGEPVAWQWRSRIKGGAWDAWENGRYDFEPAPFMDVEHRGLYAAPPAAAHGDEAVRVDARLLELYQAPFRFDERGGYIWDAQNTMVADNHVDGDQAIRVRGWGRLSYRKDGEEVQDLMGQAMADALTARWEAAMRAQEEK